MIETKAKSAAAQPAQDHEWIMATLLDALCSPQLYEIALRGGELLIKPRTGMHIPKCH